MLLELGFEPRKERERVGSCAGEAGDDTVAIELADLAGPALTIVLPIETCPSPATATWPRWRTATTVVEWMRSSGIMGRALPESARKTRGVPAHVGPAQVISRGRADERRRTRA
jgi:hypothetical protein